MMGELASDNADRVLQPGVRYPESDDPSRSRGG